MFCKKCGQTIDDDSIYCSYCGTKQSSVLTNDNVSPIIDSKTVNVNLSFGRPSAPNEQIEKVKIEKFDSTYSKETEASIVGIISLILSFVILISAGFNNPELARVISIAGLLLRIFYTIWCVNIAKRQNRDASTWGLFAFFLPSLALIIVGQLRKLKNNNSNTSVRTNDNHLKFNPNKFTITLDNTNPPKKIYEALKNDSFTLKHFIKEPNNYITAYGEQLPFFSALELNRRNDLLEDELINCLNNYSKTLGYKSFFEMLNNYSNA